MTHDIGRILEYFLHRPSHAREVSQSKVFLIIPMHKLAQAEQ